MLSSQTGDFCVYAAAVPLDFSTQIWSDMQQSSKGALQGCLCSFVLSGGGNDMRRPGCAGRVRPCAGYERRHTVPFLRAVRKAAVSVRRRGAMVRLMPAAARRGNCRQGAWRRRYSRSIAQSLRSEIFQNDNKRRLAHAGSLLLCVLSKTGAS